MMKVCVVCNEDKFITGVSRYSYDLKQALSPTIKLNCIQTSEIIPKILILLTKLFFIDPKLVFSAYPLFLSFKGRGDIIHLTNQNFVIPLLFNICRCSCIVTVHDLILLEQTENWVKNDLRSWKQKLFLKLLPYALRKADRIIADSYFTKQKIIKMIKYPADKISVVPLGVDTKLFYPLRIKRAPYTILYVGSEVSRKNLSVLIKAFAILKKRLPQAKLIKVGKSQDSNGRIQLVKLITELRLTKSIIFKEYILDLSKEYSAAKIFVFPSLYEGFGLPVLEAMACGCPVICSNKTSLPEVGGNAALYFDGQDINDLSNKMYELLTNTRLWLKLRRDGLRRARQFTWKRTAEETIAAYNRIENK